MPSRCQKLAQLSWAERGLLLLACLMLLFTILALRLVGFRRWHAVLARWGPIRGLPSDQEADPLLRQACATVRRMTAVAALGAYRVNCLERSLVLWWLLGRLGIESDLRIGVQRDGDRLAAHAWVESGGLVLHEADDVRERFATFDHAILPLGPRRR